MLKNKIGLVISKKMQKTLVVQVNKTYKHSKYLKILKKSEKLFVDDTFQKANVGNLVEIVYSKPLSKFKRWILKEIVN